MISRNFWSKVRQLFILAKALSFYPAFLQREFMWTSKIFINKHAKLFLVVATCDLCEIWSIDLFKYAEFDDHIYFFCFLLEIPFLEKLVPHYQSCWKYLFSLFKYIISSFCFDKLVEISENTSALQSSFLITNTE